MIKNFLIIFILWLITILFTAIWTFENPEKIEKIKSHFKKKQTLQVEDVEDEGQKFIANSFSVEVKKVLDFNDKTAFVSYNEFNDVFDQKKLEIYTQTGKLIQNLQSKKINFLNISHFSETEA